MIFSVIPCITSACFQREERNRGCKTASCNDITSPMTENVKLK